MLDGTWKAELHAHILGEYLHWEGVNDEEGRNLRVTLLHFAKWLLLEARYELAFLPWMADFVERTGLPYPPADRQKSTKGTGVEPAAGEAGAEKRGRRGRKAKYTPRLLLNVHTVWREFHEQGGSLEKFLHERHDLHNCDTLAALKRLVDSANRYARKHSE
jgi:hypothetical protein